MAKHMACGTRAIVIPRKFWYQTGVKHISAFVVVCIGMSIMQLCTCHSTNRVVYIRINSEALSVPEKFACFVVEATTLCYFQLVQLYQVTSGSFSAIEKHVSCQHGDTPFCFLFQS